MSDTSLNTHIPALQGRGVNVQFGALKPAVEEKERGMIPEDWEAGDYIHRGRMKEKKDIITTPPHHPTSGHGTTVPKIANTGSRL